MASGWPGKGHGALLKVGTEPKVTTNRAPEAPKGPKFGVFGAPSGVGVGIVGVFQQAVMFHALG